MKKILSLTTFFYVNPTRCLYQYWNKEVTDQGTFPGFEYCHHGRPPTHMDNKNMRTTPDKNKL